MSLLKKALETLQGQFDDNGDDWFDSLIDKLDDLIVNTQDETLKEGGVVALGVLKKNKTRLVGLGSSGLTLFVSHAAAGNEEAATLEYIRKEASVDELIDGVLGDAVKVAQDKVDRDMMKATALEILKEIGAAGARFLLPLLLAAI
jgi:hypothetical protein